MIHIAARQSPLSQAQVKEVLNALNEFYPDATFQTTFVETHGDQDQQTSLRTLDKTDFFTREIDQLVQSGICQAGIHSAKDLPDPLPDDLAIAAITEGVDPSDSLVLREGETVKTLPPGALVATSSPRREEAVRALRSDLKFCDLRGTIGQRLTLLETGEADGVVVAEAALIRLGLTHLNRVRLPGETVPGQGKLAIVVQKEDRETAKLFECIK